MDNRQPPLDGTHEELVKWALENKVKPFIEEMKELGFDAISMICSDPGMSQVEQVAYHYTGRVTCLLTVLDVVQYDLSGTCGPDVEGPHEPKDKDS